MEYVAPSATVAGPARDHGGDRVCVSSTAGDSDFLANEGTVGFERLHCRGMGEASEGFDIYPPLDASEKEQWQGFLNEASETFAPFVQWSEDGLIFCLDGFPTLPRTSWRFRTFCSGASGNSGVRKILMGVCELARLYFGKERVHWWSELDGSFAIYTQAEICHAAQQLDEPFPSDDTLSY